MMFLLEELYKSDCWYDCSIFKRNYKLVDKVWKHDFGACGKMIFSLVLN